MTLRQLQYAPINEVEEERKSDASSEDAQDQLLAFKHPANKNLATFFKPFDRNALVKQSNRSNRPKRPEFSPMEEGVLVFKVCPSSEIRKINTEEAKKSISESSKRSDSSHGMNQISGRVNSMGVLPINNFQSRLVNQVARSLA